MRGNSSAFHLFFYRMKYFQPEILYVSSLVRPQCILHDPTQNYIKTQTIGNPHKITKAMKENVFHMEFWGCEGHCVWQ